MVTGSNARVVILFPGALGDLILAMGALAAVRARHAGAHVTLAVRDSLRALAATTDVADRIVSLDGADAIGLFGGPSLPAWFGEKPIVYGWVGSRDADVAARLRSHARRTALFSVIRDDGSEHAAVAYLRQVGANGAVAAWRWPSALASARAADVRGAIDRPLLALHAGAGARRKRWAPDAFVELAKRWCDRGGAVVEIAGPAEEDTAPLPHATWRAVDWPLPDVAALLARADAYAGNDSGVSHLAGAVGAAGVAVFGPTSARRWAPRGGSIEPLQARGPFADGIATRALPVARAWDALGRRGCLDKLQGRK